MHILILPSWYKSKKNPVLGSFFEEQARALKALGHQVGILHIEYESYFSKNSAIAGDEDDKGLRTIRKSVKAIVPRFPSINYRHLGIEANKVFANYVEHYGQPDIIHAHSVFWGGIAAYFINKETKIKFVITEHLTSFLTGTITSKTDIRYAKKVFEAAAAKIVVSETFRSELSNFLDIEQGEFVVIHNMVAPIFFENRKDIVLGDQQQLVFFTNSFLSGRKNLELLIRSFALFTKKYPNSVVYIAGKAINAQDENYVDSLKALCKEIEVDSQVVFLGELSRKEVKRQLDTSHIFLLTSEYETFGVVLIEALAVGRPVITTDSKGPREIVRQDNGVMVSNFESEQFCNAMFEVVKNFAAYNQAKISEDCSERFGEEVIAREIVDVYINVTKSAEIANSK